MSRARRRDPLVVTTVAGLAVFMTILVAVMQGWRPLQRLDSWSLSSLHRVAIEHTGWTQFMRDVSDAGTLYAYAPVFGVIVLVLLLRRRSAEALIVVATLLTNTRLNDLVKGLVGRERPVLPSPVDVAPGLSFPSGHAQASVVAWTLMAWLVTRVVSGRWRWVAAALAASAVLAIGFSRVALGVHYPSDVLAGYALGGAWVAPALVLLRWKGDTARPGPSGVAR